MAVLFYDPNDKQDLIILDDLEKIDDDCRRFDIDFIKVSDAEEATQYGTDNVTRLSPIVEILKILSQYFYYFNKKSKKIVLNRMNFHFFT